MPCKSFFEDRCWVMFFGNEAHKKQLALANSDEISFISLRAPEYHAFWPPRDHTFREEPQRTIALRLFQGGHPYVRPVDREVLADGNASEEQMSKYIILTSPDSPPQMVNVCLWNRVSRGLKAELTSVGKIREIEETYGSERLYRLGDDECANIANALSSAHTDIAYEHYVRFQNMICVAPYYDEPDIYEASLAIARQLQETP